MTNKNTGRNSALAAALTLLGASLGVSAAAGAETTSHHEKWQPPLASTQIKGETTGTQIKGETTSNQHKGQAPSAIYMKYDAPASRQIKGETTANQHKGQAPSARFVKIEVPPGNDRATSNQHKEQAPSAMFLKKNEPVSKQIKVELQDIVITKTK